MKQILLLLAISVSFSLSAAEVILGVNGRTKHQIVIPDSFANKVAEESVIRAAKLMKKVFAASRISMDIVRESKIDRKKNQIYLGATKFAKQHGVDVSKLEHWQSVWKSVGKHLIIAGNDRPCLTGRKKAPYRTTLFGVCEFLYRYAGTRFLKPGPECLGIVPKAVIRLETPCNKIIFPWLIEHSGSYFSINELYGIANHVVPMQTVYGYYGHTHYLAFKNKGYEKTHPEYYALINGVRQTSGTHYCFSNPQVREIIYKYMLECCNKGSVVQLGQDDAFTPCQCENCRKLYGFSPSTIPSDGSRWINDPCWGKQIWKMHIDMMKRLQKDRPGKKVEVLAYSNTRLPPLELTKELPANAIPLLCMFGGEEQTMAEWEKMKVPGGYANYTYYAYGLPGLTPMRNINYFKSLWKLYRKFNVRYIDENVPTRTWGLRGPADYVQLRLGVSPDYKTPDELYSEYLEAAFVEAETPMKRFFNTLYKCTELWNINQNYLYKHGRDIIRTFQIMYTPEIIAKMEKDLKRAEKTVNDPTAKKRLKTVRGEFDYLKNIVNVVYAYQEYKRVNSAEAFKSLLNALEQREKQIDRMIAASGSPYNPLPVKNKKFFLENGNRAYLAVAPFNWNIAEMRKSGPAFLTEKSMTAEKTHAKVALNSNEWEKAAAHRLSLPRGLNGKTKTNTAFKLLYDDKNIYIKVIADLKPALMKQIKPRAHDAEIWLQESIVLNISPKADKSQYYYLTYEPAAGSFADAEHGFITDTADPRYGWNDWNWNGKWSYETQYDAKNGKWISMAVIPFKTLRTKTPQKGDIWNFNIGRVHFFAPDLKSKGRELQVWTGKLNPSKVSGDASMGELVFE